MPNFYESGSQFYSYTTHLPARVLYIKYFPKGWTKSSLNPFLMCFKMTNNYLWLNNSYKIKWFDQDSNLQGRKGRVSIWGTRKILLGCRLKTKKVLRTNLVQSLETRVLYLLLLFCLFASGSQKRACRADKNTQSFRMEAGQLTGIFKSKGI